MTTDPLSPADLELISCRQAVAEAAVDNRLEPGDDYDEAWDQVTRLVRDDVPRLLCALEERGVNRDEGYVAGLRRAATWLKWMASDPVATGLDVPTMARLTAGMDAFAASAAVRLGVDAVAPEDVAGKPAESTA